MNMELEIGSESLVSSIRGLMYNVFIDGKKYLTLNLSKDLG